MAHCIVSYHMTDGSWANNANANMDKTWHQDGLRDQNIAYGKTSIKAELLEIVKINVSDLKKYVVNEMALNENIFVLGPILNQGWER